MRTPMTEDADAYWGGRNPEISHPDQKVWADRMGAKGWTAPEWPSEYGGGGLDKEQAKVLREELRAIGARHPLESFGISMLGPALIKYGTEATKTGAPAENCPRRNPLVPGLQRAGCRQRPGQPANQGRGQGRSLPC